MKDRARRGAFQRGGGPPNPPSGTRPMSCSLPRLGLIGVSGYGRIHLDLIRELAERNLVQLVAAVVINPAEEQATVLELEQRGCRIYPDDDAMWRREKGRIDLCLIPTGIHLHARMTIAALQAGANVLVEKPLAGSSAQVDAIRRAENETGRFVAVGFQDVYAASTRWLLHVLRSGRIGEVRSVRSLCIWPRASSYFQRNAWAGRLFMRGEPVHDSPLSNACGHFALLSLVFGNCVDTGQSPHLDSAELYRARPIESFDTAVVRATGSNGVKFWLGVSHSSHIAHEPEIVIEGSAGRARWHYESTASWSNTLGESEVRAMDSAHAVRREMMAAVIRRLTDPSTPICPTELAARHTALIDAVHRSAPIVSIPAAEIEWAPSVDAPNAVPSVRHLDEALHSAFANGGTLATAGFGRKPAEPPGPQTVPMSR
jgi:predicted dehydrogenase